MNKKLLRNLVNKAIKNSVKEGKAVEKNVLNYTSVFKKLPTSDAISALTAYLRGLRQSLNQHILIIESSTPLSAEEINKIKKMFTAKFKINDFKINTNPSLKGGIRVKIGDFVYDDSLDRKINQLRAAIAG